MTIEIAGAKTPILGAARDARRRSTNPIAELVHILSPFDPLIIQRKRLNLFFGYEHRFEAYVPKEKRVFGYFALPVLVGDEIVAALDLKTDREKGKLLIQKWTWVGDGAASRPQAADRRGIGPVRAVSARGLVGWAKRSVPTRMVRRRSGRDGRVGTRRFAHPTQSPAPSAP